MICSTCKPQLCQAGSPNLKQQKHVCFFNNPLPRSMLLISIREACARKLGWIFFLFQNSFWSPPHALFRKFFLNSDKVSDNFFLNYEKCPKNALREAINCKKKDFLWNPFIKWWPPPRPPFMKSLFIFFSTIFWSKKKDDFEGCLKGVNGCLKGVAGCLKCVWRVFGKIK